jgi:hypothetical protein
MNHALDKKNFPTCRDIFAQRSALGTQHYQKNKIDEFQWLPSFPNLTWNVKSCCCAQIDTPGDFFDYLNGQVCSHINIASREYLLCFLPRHHRRLRSSWTLPRNDFCVMLRVQSESFSMRLYTCMYVCMDAYGCVDACVYVCVCVHACMYVRTCVCMLACVPRR